MGAYVDQLCIEHDAELMSKGYTHVVVLLDEIYNDVLDLVDFKNEFAAQTYADSINLKGGHHA